MDVDLHIPLRRLIELRIEHADLNAVMTAPVMKADSWPARRTAPATLTPDELPLIADAFVRVDNAIMRVGDTLLSIPNLLMVETIETGGAFHLKLIRNSIRWGMG